MSAAIYVRISRDTEGKGLGVERQQEACRELCEREKLSVGDLYSDNDVSAYSGRLRPSYRRLLADIEAGKITAVVAWHTDRLHRSPMELEEYAALCEKHNVPTYTHQAGHLDLTTPSGRMTARIVGAVARHESEHKSARLRDKHQQLREQGAMTGARSFGYALDTHGHLTGDLEPEEAALLTEAAERVLAGDSPYRIAADWNERGLTTTRGGRWTHANLKLTLENPKNAGFKTHQRQIVGEGTWTPIFDRDTWERLCAVLGRKSHMRAGATKHLLGGLLTCECGSVMYGQSKSDHRTKNKVVGYACSRSHFIVKSKVEPTVINALASAALCGPSEPFKAPSGTTTLRERANALEAAQSRVFDAYADGLVSKAQFQKKAAEIEAEMAQINAALDAELAVAASSNQITELVRDLWVTHRGSFTEAAKTKAQIRSQIAEMEFERLRAIIRGSLEVTVMRGRGDRVRITHLVATSLNESEVEEVA